MNTVLACVDAHGHPSAVCDGATWVAHRLHAPLNFLQVVDESEAHTGETHFSDLTGYDASPTRTQALDAMPGSHIIGGQSHSQQLLEGVRARALHLGHSMVELSLRQGKLTDALLDLSAETRMVVMGLHSHHLDSPWRQGSHHLEQALQAVQQPMLVVTRSHFTPPSAFALAYHGGAESLQLVDAVADCELLQGLPCHLVHVGARNPDNNPVVHDVEVFGPVATLMPYRDEAHALALVRRGQGSLVASVYGTQADDLARIALALADSHGRVHVISPDVKAAHTGHGNVMPQSQHGGPGRAGGGEELGGLRALRFYHQRCAIQANNCQACQTSTNRNGAGVSTGSYNNRLPACSRSHRSLNCCEATISDEQEFAVCSTQLLDVQHSV